MHVLVTRPLEDGEEIAARLGQMGHTALLAPLLTPHFDAGPEPDFTDVQAILASSANGIRALVRRTARRDIPVFAVGPQTAREAAAAGFSDIKNADGDARALAEAASRWADPDRGVLLHVCGAEAPGTLADMLTLRDFSVRRAVLYRAEAARELSSDARKALAAGKADVTLFFSPRSAQLFCELARDLPTEKLIALCISPATARALTAVFKAVRIADKPNQEALLALLN